MSLLRFEGRIVEVGTGVRGVRVERDDDGSGEPFAPDVARFPVTLKEAKRVGARVDDDVVVTVQLRSEVEKRRNRVRPWSCGSCGVTAQGPRCRKCGKEFLFIEDRLWPTDADTAKIQRDDIGNPLKMEPGETTKRARILAVVDVAQRMAKAMEAGLGTSALGLEFIGTVAALKPGDVP